MADPLKQSPKRDEENSPDRELRREHWIEPFRILSLLVADVQQQHMLELSQMVNRCRR